MKVRCYNIKWDTTDTGSESDYDSDDVTALGLPIEADVVLTEDDTEDDIVDILSDRYGFCIFSFQFEKEEGNS